MSNRSDVSPSRGRILDSLSQMFKKKDPEDKATPMMLGKDANFKYDPLKKKYIFLDEPLEDQVDEIIAPPKMDKQINQVQAQSVTTTNSLMTPPQNAALNRRKIQAKVPEKLAPLQVKMEFNVQAEEKLDQFTPELRPQIAKQMDQQTSPMGNHSGFWKVDPSVPDNQKQDSFKQLSVLKDKDALQEQNQKEFEFFLVMNIANLSVKPKRLNQFEQSVSLISTLIQNIQLQHTNDDYTLDITHKSLLKDTIQLCVEQIKQIPFNNQQNYLKKYLSQIKQQEQIQINNNQQLYSKQIEFYIQIIQQVQEELAQQNNLIEKLIIEFNIKDSVIASQNNLIQDMIVKLNEFSTHCDNLRSQMDQLKEEKHLLTKQKQTMQSNLFEFDIELKNSRKETEIYFKQLSSSQKEKDSYIRYYEELRKEMQEDISALNTRLEESLNMSTTENQAALIENYQLKQQLDIYTAENKLLESDYKNHVYLEQSHKLEIKNILENDLSNIANMLNVPTEFLSLTISDNQCLEIRKILFTLQKEISQSIKRKDNEHIKALDDLKVNIQSQNLKMNQMNNQLSNYHNQLNQYQKLFLDTRQQQSKSSLEREKQVMQMVKENEVYKLQIKYLQSNVQTQQRDIGQYQNEQNNILNNLEASLQQDRKSSVQNNKLIEQFMSQFKDLIDEREKNQLIQNQFESENRQLLDKLNQSIMEREALKQELKDSKEHQIKINHKLLAAEDQIEELKQSTQYSEQIMSELQLALQDLTKEFIQQRQEYQQLEQESEEEQKYLTDQIQLKEFELQKKEEIIINLMSNQKNYKEEVDQEYILDKQRDIQTSSHIDQIDELNQMLDKSNKEKVSSEALYQNKIQNLNEQLAISESKLNDIEILNSQLKSLLSAALLSQDHLNRELNDVKIQLAKVQEQKQSSQQDSQEDDEKDILLVEYQQALKKTTDELQDVMRQLEAQGYEAEIQQQKMKQLNEEIQLEQKKRQQIQDVLIKQQQENQELYSQLDEMKEQWEMVDKENQNLSSQQIIQNETQFETMIESQSQVIQQLTEQLQEYQNNTLQEELDNLKTLYAQKIKLIEKLKSEIEIHQNKKLDIAELQSENESKEQTIVQLLMEKKVLLRQIDEFQNQLDMNSLAQKNKELAQRITNIEEERLMLKENLEDIIRQSNEQVYQLTQLQSSKYKDDLTDTQGQLLQARAQRDEIKAQLTENIAQVLLKPNSQNKLQNPPIQPNSGVLGKLATFFVTESEMKKINSQK